MQHQPLPFSLEYLPHLARGLAYLALDLVHATLLHDDFHLLLRVVLDSYLGLQRVLFASEKVLPHGDVEHVDCCLLGGLGEGQVGEGEVPGALLGLGRVLLGVQVRQVGLQWLLRTVRH